MHTHMHTYTYAHRDLYHYTAMAVLCVECAKGLLPSSECANLNCSVVLIEEVDDTTDYSINGVISVSRGRSDHENPVLNYCTNAAC